MPDERYTLKKQDDGCWCVVDVATDVPATVRDRVLILMDETEARDAATLMNMMEHMRRRRPAARAATAREEARGFLAPIGWSR